MNSLENIQELLSHCHHHTPVEDIRNTINKAVSDVGCGPTLLIARIKRGSLCLCSVSELTYDKRSPEYTIPLMTGTEPITEVKDILKRHAGKTYTLSAFDQRILKSSVG